MSGMSREIEGNREGLSWFLVLGFWLQASGR